MSSTRVTEREITKKNEQDRTQCNHADYARAALRMNIEPRPPILSAEKTEEEKEAREGNGKLEEWG